MKKVDSVPAYILINIIYLIIPISLLTAPFWEGSLTSFYSVLNFIVTFFLFMFGLWSGDGDYFGDINGKYQKIFFTLAAIFVILMIASYYLYIHISKALWSVIDIITGVYLLFYYVERKINHRK